MTANVYDSPTGRILLVPQGARLIGEYDSEVAAGQTRVLLAWNRLIMPGGLSIILERQLAADAAGFAGLQDRVDQRRGNLLRAAAVSTLLGVGAELGAEGRTISSAHCVAVRKVRSTRPASGSSIGSSMYNQRSPSGPAIRFG